MTAHHCPLFMTHHAPIGAWSSLTFGLAGRGVSIDTEALAVAESADLLAGVSRGPGQVTLLPFYRGAAQVDVEARNLAAPGAAGSRHGQTIDPASIRRELTPAVDAFTGGPLTLKVYTPHPAIPDPQSGEDLSAACIPGLLLELEVDNRSHDEAAWGFLGLGYRLDGRMRPLDWSAPGQLCGLAMKDHWALAARPAGQEVFTIRDNSVRHHLENPHPVDHPGGNEGVIAFAVPAGQHCTMRFAFGFYRPGRATQGIHGRYAYTRWYDSVEAVCEAVLDRAEAIRQECRQFDAETSTATSDPRRLELFSQAIRGHAANTSLIETDDGRLLYSVCEGQFAWRNTLDLAADHLPWELWRFPWVVRNIMDLYIERYSYTDQTRHRGETAFNHPGGLAFCHDQGNYTCYAPPHRSGYEMTGTRHYCHMTTEQVLNGAYCIAAYVLTQRDEATQRRWADTAAALVESLENRDDPDPAKRNGMLEGESSRCGEGGHEITTYDALDPALCSARGNLYVHVKAWCAAVMLEAMLIQAGRETEATRARAVAERTAAAIEQRFDTARRCLPGNLDQGQGPLVIAAIEPLAVPAWCGLAGQLQRHDRLMQMLADHARTCLEPGAALEPETGGLRLSSGSDNSWPSKGVLCHYVLESILGIDTEAVCPTVLREFTGWMQHAAAERTLSDQMLVSQRLAKAGSYYPRHVTTALWIKPAAPRSPHE